MPKLSLLLSPDKIYPFLLTLTPFVFFEYFSDPIQTPVFLFLNLLCLVIQLLIPFGAAGEKSDLRHNNSFFIILTLLSLLLCIGISSTIYNRGNTESYYELARTSSLIVFFGTNALMLSQSKYSLDRLILGLSACSFIYLGMGLYESFMMGSYFFDTQMSYDIKAHLGHRNLMANFFALSMPLYSYIIYTSQSRIARYTASIVLFIAIVFLSFLASRVGWAGMAAFLIINGIWLIYGRKEMTSKSALLPIGTAMLAIVILLGVLLTNPHLSMNIRKKVRSLTALKQNVNENSYTLNERLTLWHMSLSLVKDHPLTGVGPGLWKFNYPYQGLQGTQAQTGKVLFQRPHNDLLWYASEYGLPGLLVFLSIILFVLYCSFRQIISADRLKAYLSAAGVFIFIVICFFDFPKERPVHLFLLSFYFSISATLIPSISIPNVITHFWVRRYRIVIFSLTCIISLFFCIRAIGEYNLNQVLVYRLMRRYPDMRTAISKCEKNMVDYDLTGTPLEFYLGEASFYENKPYKAIGYFNKSLERNPYHLYTLSDLGSCYWVLHKHKEAFDQWDKAISIAPDFAEARLNKSIALYQVKDLKAATYNLKFNMLDSDIPTYQRQIIVIYGKFILQLSDSISEPLVRDEMRKIAMTDIWTINLYKKMKIRSETPATAALNEALWVLCKEKKEIDPADCENIRKKYALLLQ